MSDKEPRDPGRPLRLDPAAASAEAGKPAFVARPAGAPVYHGFPLVEATRTEGWCYGAITEFDNPDGLEAGDGFVEAPDGTRAGLVWSVGSYPIREVCRATPDRWGVYAVAFPKAVHTEDELVECFRHVLPDLRAAHARVRHERKRRRWWPFGRR